MLFVSDHCAGLLTASSHHRNRRALLIGLTVGCIETKSSFKKTTPAFIDILVLNSIIPLRFLYMQSKGYSYDAMDDLLDIIRLIKPEKNNIVAKYEGIGVDVSSALSSQSLLTLHKNYCNEFCCYFPVQLENTIGKDRDIL